MSKVEMKKVVSSNIDSIGFSDTRNLLFVVFSGGGMYTYENATKEQFDSLLTSPSVGRTIRTVTAGMKYNKIPVENQEAILTEGVELDKVEEQEKPEQQEQVKEKTTNLLRVLLSYYQGEGDRVENPVKSVYGNDCNIGDMVYSVLVVQEDKKKILLPVLYKEVEKLDADYYCDDLVMDEEQVGVLVLCKRGGVSVE
jgi:hypothetical protein